VRILVVSATYLEIAPLLSRVGAPNFGEQKHLSAGTTVSIPTREGDDHLSCLITGVGQASAAYHLGSFLRKGAWDLALQVGIAGSFSSALKKCQVVRVESEVFADLGAEDNGSYLDLFEMGLLQPNEFPYSEGRLKVTTPSVGDRFDSTRISLLPSVASVTVNRVLSEPHSISWITERYAPDVVSMEGGAFFYAALQSGVPVIQLRSISDYVGPRDKSTWDINGAIASLNEEIFSFLHPLISSTTE
jgi:futalosine hydrolase